MAASGIVTEAQRNVFNTVRQAFAFSRSFLNKVRREGAIFHSPFPDYYLANMAIGMGDTIAVSPQPLTVAGVSRASFGYTLFNNLEAEGATLLNTKLREDPLYATCEPHFLPGPTYNTNYILTMAHVVQKLGYRSPGPVDYWRYRRLQIFAVITAQGRLGWMRTETGAALWAKLTGPEKIWASYIGVLNWRAKAGHVRTVRRVEAVKKDVEPYGFANIMLNRVAGRFARLPELFDALEAGTYPPPVEGLSCPR